MRSVLQQTYWRHSIASDYSVLELPSGMPDELLKHRKVWLAGRQLDMTELGLRHLSEKASVVKPDVQRQKLVMTVQSQQKR